MFSAEAIQSRHHCRIGLKRRRTHQDLVDGVRSVSHPRVMGVHDTVKRIWYSRVPRTSRRNLSELYYRTDWKFLGAVIALVLGIGAAAASLGPSAY